MLEIKSIKDKLSAKFEMKDMGIARTMLGIEIPRNRSVKQLFISQIEYTTTVLERFGMQNSKSISTPMDKSYLKSIGKNSKPVNNVPYRQAVGSLMYLMVSSRPDKAFAIEKLSQRCENLCENDWVALKRLLRYTNSTRTFGILCDGSKPLGTNVQSLFQKN